MVVFVILDLKKCLTLMISISAVDGNKKKNCYRTNPVCISRNTSRTVFLTFANWREPSLFCAKPLKPMLMNARTVVSPLDLGGMKPFAVSTCISWMNRCKSDRLMVQWMDSTVIAYME